MHVQPGQNAKLRNWAAAMKNQNEQAHQRLYNRTAKTRRGGSTSTVSANPLVAWRSLMLYLIRQMLASMSSANSQLSSPLLFINMPVHNAHPRTRRTISRAFPPRCPHSSHGESLAAEWPQIIPTTKNRGVPSSALFQHYQQVRLIHNDILSC